MAGKKERQILIREIIRSNTVASQEELSALLEKNGMTVAQATLSRDIREMRISKIHDEKGYHYSLQPSVERRIAAYGGNLLSESIDSLEFSGSVAVMATRPGHANMIAAIVDAQRSPEIIGTIAGDDTILLIIREGYDRDEVTAALSGLFPGIEKKRTNNKQ